MELVHCGTKDQLADIQTKPLKLDVFLRLREELGVCSIKLNVRPQFSLREELLAFPGILV
jgi:hypothetical protein